jgi:hypothetical protein
LNQTENAIRGLDGETLKQNDALRRNVRDQIDSILGAFDF